MSDHIELGDQVRDVVTGFKGIVVGRSDWLNGCTRFAIQGTELKDAVPTEAQWIDQEQLAVSKKQAMPKPKVPHGGPHPIPQRRTDAKR